jgi:molybdopterin biosynthesis enzyme
MVKLVIKGNEPKEDNVVKVWLEYINDDIYVVSSGKYGSRQIMMRIYSDGTLVVPENYNIKRREDWDCPHGY